MNIDYYEVYKKLRAFIKLIPFIYVAFYLIAYLTYLICNEVLSEICDLLFYTSPLIVAINVYLSHLVPLCRWHKTACLIPLLSLVGLIIDNIFCLSETGLYMNLITLIIISILFIVSAYKVFIKT